MTNLSVWPGPFLLLTDETRTETETWHETCRQPCDCPTVLMAMADGVSVSDVSFNTEDNDLCNDLLDFGLESMASGNEPLALFLWVSLTALGLEVTTPTQTSHTPILFICRLWVIYYTVCQLYDMSWYVTCHTVYHMSHVHQPGYELFCLCFQGRTNPSVHTPDRSILTGLRLFVMRSGCAICHFNKMANWLRGFSAVIPNLWLESGWRDSFWCGAWAMAQGEALSLISLLRSSPLRSSASEVYHCWRLCRSWYSYILYVTCLSLSMGCNTWNLAVYITAVVDVMCCDASCYCTTTCYHCAVLRPLPVPLPPLTKVKLQL